jgi:hypothetical protein
MSSVTSVDGITSSLADYDYYYSYPLRHTANLYDTEMETVVSKMSKKTVD